MFDLSAPLLFDMLVQALRRIEFGNPDTSGKPFPSYAGDLHQVDSREAL
jgi:hypothetical protein